MCSGCFAVGVLASPRSYHARTANTNTGSAALGRPRRTRAGTPLASRRRTGRSCKREYRLPERNNVSQTILKHSAFTNASLYVTCPKCDHEHKIGLVAFVHAINYGGAIECVACGNSFTIRLTRQPRAAELPLERNAQQNCPDCGGSGYLVDEEGNEHQCLLCL